MVFRNMPFQAEILEKRILLSWQASHRDDNDSLSSGEALSHYSSFLTVSAGRERCRFMSR